MRRLLRELSGGPNARWIIIPTALDDARLELLKRQSESNAELSRQSTFLHTRDRDEANSDDFVEPLKSATAVSFTGGRQWRLADAYLDTRTERELRGVLDRGGLIMGTSAGATIQGSYLVRGAPEGNSVMMAPGHERGFAYLSNVAIDQHVIARHRERDLSQVIAIHPNLLGIGIDEGASALVQGSTLTVFGSSDVLITDGEDHGGLPFYALHPGDRFDLPTRTTVAR